MNVPETIEGEFRETTALALRDDGGASPLFGTTDPVEIISSAVRVADALKSVVVAKRLISNIGGKEYPQVEAWLTLAAMLRLTTVCEWSRAVPDGWEARVYVRDASGATVGAAEAQCLATERSKRTWEGYAIRSMAQTRATSKALRSVLGFIMTLAGYSPTPAEEMPEPPAIAVVEHPMVHAKRLGIDNLKGWALERNVPWTQSALHAALDAHEAAPKKTTPASPSDAQKKLYFALCKELGMDDEKRHAFNEITVDKSSFKEFTIDDARVAITELNRRIDEQNAV